MKLSIPYTRLDCKKAILFAATLLTVSQSHAIIYRHDVAEDKYRALAQQQQFDCVGEAFDMSTGTSPVGSCVLIGDRWILSAAHVYVKSDYRNDTVMIGDKQAVVYQPINQRIGDANNYQFRFKRRLYRGKSIKVMPQYMKNGDYDIVVIELDEPVKDVTPATLNRLYDEQGAIATLVGFGVSGNAGNPEDVGPYFNKLAGQNMVDSVNGPRYNDHSTILAFDFDHPSEKQLSTMGTVKALSLESLCGGGDSGGGMFRQRDGKWELIGISAGSKTDIDKLLKNGYYGQEGMYTAVAPFYQWISENTKPTDASVK